MRRCTPQIPMKKKPVSSILKRSLSINPPCSTRRFAARKAERETAQPPQAKPAAPRPAAKPVKRQVPAAQKNKSVSHERRLYSGETPSDAALRITRQIAALVLCLLFVCGGFSGKGHRVGHFGPTAILKMCRKVRITVLPQTVHNFA